MTTRKPSTAVNSKKSWLFLLLFSLPFAAVGAGMGGWLLWDVVSYCRMLSWVETPAQIVQAELKSHAGSKRTTYEVTGEYSYQYQGRQFTGTRVGITGGSGNFGAFHQDAYQQLSEYRQSGRPMPCFVNPANPNEAILFRNLRLDTVVFRTSFALIFGGPGFGMLAFAIYSLRKQKRNQTITALHPDEPWLCKTDWADGKIRSSSGVITLGMVLFAVYWNVFCIPITWAVFQQKAFAQKSPWEWLILIFPAVGLILFVAAAVSVRRSCKYGRSVFEMASMPGVIGGQLAGVVRVSKKVPSEDGFRLTLNCIRRTITQSGKNSSVHENILWQDEQHLALELLQNDPEQTAIPVLFQIPYECLPTDETNDNNEIIWRLELAAKTPGLDYAATFEVPVFKTPESDPKFVVDRSLIAKYAAPEDPERDLAEAGLRKDLSPSGDFRLIFPMARHPGTAIMATLFGLVFCAVPYVIYRFDGAIWLALFFGGIFCLIGLAILFVGLNLWFYRSTVDVSPSGINVVGGWFGLGSPRWIDAGDIHSIVPRSRMSSGQGPKKKMFYDIDLIRVGKGKTITLGKNVPGKRLVESVIRQIEEPLTRSIQR